MSLDGTLLAVGGEGKDAPGNVRVRRLDDKAEPVSPPLPHPEPVIEIMFEADGTTLRTARCPSQHSALGVCDRPTP